MPGRSKLSLDGVSNAIDLIGSRSGALLLRLGDMRAFVLIAPDDCTFLRLPSGPTRDSLLDRRDRID